jgi:hypothetical protein
MEHSPGRDPPCSQPPATERRAHERAELIENLAQLVVRQHRRQQRSNPMPKKKSIDLPPLQDANDADK